MSNHPDNETIRIPLVIGVTGHRDLVATELDTLRVRVERLFDELRVTFPHTPLRLMSSLAEGADRLAAHVALDAGCELQAILPMPTSLYRTDFKSAASQAEFDALCAHADVLELPSNETERGEMDVPGTGRDMAYANAGIFISAHCHILLALWDGNTTDKVGGTAQVIYFHHYDRLPGIAESVPRSSLFLTDDESDLVHHIPCSREGSPRDAARDATFSACWFTTHPDTPRTEKMPRQYVRVFQRMDEYNRDMGGFLWRKTTCDPAAADLPSADTLTAAECIRQPYCIADMLANRFQKRINATLTAIHTLAVLTGLAFIFYSEVQGLESLIFAFLVCLLVGMMLAHLANRRQWHRKYLDYRVLAEGLRVQFYWAVSGIHGKGHTKFAYDNFLRQRDMELGWIRNVMRVAGTRMDAEAIAPDSERLQMAIDHWIGSGQRSGQLGYYRVKARKRAQLNRYTDILAVVSLWGGIAAAVVLAFFLEQVGPDLHDPLMVLMGVLPLIAGVAEVYTRRKANREVTKQYRFMERVFSNAGRRLAEAAHDGERREILRGLGDAALSEHAEWILVHRERQPDGGGL